MKKFILTIVVLCLGPSATYAKEAYTERSSVSFSGHYIGQDSSWNRFSRGGGGQMDVKLVHFILNKMGRLDFSLGHFLGKLSEGRYRGTNGNLNLFLGRTFSGIGIRPQVAAGVGFDFLQVKGWYRQRDFDFLLGAVKFLLMGRVDSALVSVELLAGLGGGGHRIGNGHTLIRADFSGQVELHVCKKVDLLGKFGVLYDKYSRRAVSKYLTNLYQRGCVKAYVKRDVYGLTCVEYGRFSGLIKTTYVKSTLSFGRDL